MATISRHSTFYDVLEALGQPGCAICTLVARTRWRYLDSLAYEHVNDPGVREKIREALGFCNRHAWYFVEAVREVFGAAIIYRDILHTVQRATSGGLTRGALDPTGPCPACAAEWQAAADALLILSEAMDEPDFRSALAQSEGLCGPHLLQAMAIVSPDKRHGVLGMVREVWQHPVDDSRRYRWRATGAAGLFPRDDLALASNASSHKITASATLDEPYTCPVCIATRAELDRIGSWQTLDDDTGGLCNLHAWMAQGEDCLAIYRRQIRALSDRAEALAEAAGNVWLEQARQRLGLSQPRVEASPLPLRCVVCRHQASLESALCTMVVRPLCLPHLRRAVILRGAEAIETVKPTWREIDKLLGEYLRKEDYRFRSEPRGVEQNSPRWIVALMSGAPGPR
jgi:hypothetical protein